MADKAPTTKKSRWHSIPLDNRVNPRGFDQWEVIVYPKCVAFRAKRGRTEYRMPLDVVLSQAIKVSAGNKGIQIPTGEKPKGGR